VEGSAAPVTFDIRVVDDDGDPVGDLEYWVHWVDGQKWLGIGLPVC
jgi:hypothetical protein